MSAVKKLFKALPIVGPIVGAFDSPKREKTTINVPPPPPPPPVITPQAPPPSGDIKAEGAKLQGDAEAEAAAVAAAERRKRGRRASIFTGPGGAAQSPGNVRRSILGA